MAGAEKVVTADQGGRINLGKSRAGHTFRVLEQGSHLIPEPVETVHVPAAEAWLFRNSAALGSVRRGLEQVAGRSDGGTQGGGRWRADPARSASPQPR